MSSKKINQKNHCYNTYIHEYFLLCDKTLARILEPVVTKILLNTKTFLFFRSACSVFLTGKDQSPYRKWKCHQNEVLFLNTGQKQIKTKSTLLRSSCPASGGLKEELPV